jgi:hypothetical protein
MDTRDDCFQRDGAREAEETLHELIDYVWLPRNSPSLGMA